MSIPLNAQFVRMTSAQSARLLERIVTAFAYEIQLDGVQVSREMRKL